MAESEILDQVDENGNVIGQATRAEFHSNPDIIHQVVHCWIFNKKGQILWQQRALTKATSPGKWDMSCGGHILSGDTPEITIERELEEELGITNAKVKLIKKYIATHKTQTELINLYYSILEDDDLSKLKLQEIEVEKVEWINPADAMVEVLDNKRESTFFLFSQVPVILQEMFKEQYGN